MDGKVTGHVDGQISFAEFCLVMSTTGVKGDFHALASKVLKAQRVTDQAGGPAGHRARRGGHGQPGRTIYS